MQRIKTSNLKHKYLQPNGFYKSMIFRIFILICLLSVYLIPTNILNTLIDNKIQEHQIAFDELTKQWNSETIIGPVLSIPYVERIRRIETQTDSSGVRSSVSRDKFNNKTLTLLPENLHIEAVLDNKSVTKDNHTAYTYQGEVVLSGSFNLESLPEPSAFNTIDWDQAIVAVGLNDNKSVEISTPFRWESSSTNYKPGTGLPNLLENGLHANIEDVANDNPNPEFRITLTLKGNDNFEFAPLGSITTAKITSNSQDISISGNISEKSKVYSAEGFEANWTITNLKRNYPQEWLINEGDEPLSPELSSVLAGVKLAQPISIIENLEKIKTIIFYIIPLLSVLFLSFSLLEYMRKNPIMPKFINYIVISLPVLLMPIIALALNESISFIESYLVAIIATLCLITIYLMISLRNTLYISYIFLILLSIYSFIFVVVTMPHHELLAATIAGGFIISILMIASLNLREDQELIPQGVTSPLVIDGEPRTKKLR